jgi:hypothetical protein
VLDSSDFKPGDHDGWNSEADRVRGTIQKKGTAGIGFKGYKRHASVEDPQYIIKSDKAERSHAVMNVPARAWPTPAPPFGEGFPCVTRSSLPWSFSRR